MSFQGSYAMCPKCRLVMLVGQLGNHSRGCNGQLRPANPNTLKKRRQTKAYSEASRAFLASQWDKLPCPKVPFNLRCRCPAACVLNISEMQKDGNLKKETIQNVLEGHYEVGHCSCRDSA
eukprot:Skav218152  [mRNA]  locus=scaffold2428:59830:61883:- [translate_table: standard]